MEIVNVDGNFDVLVLKNVFSENELTEMWNELVILNNKNAFLGEEDTFPARYDDGRSKKKNKSVFLDHIYAREYRFLSSILTFPEQRLLNKEVKLLMKEKNPSNGIFSHANSHTTLISYYENSDHYDFHHDQSAFTTLTYIFQEPKAFSGGEIIFRVNDHILEIPVESNMSVVFPSCYEHKVNEISMKEEDCGKMLGRFSISQFVGICV